jgi:hypothetical protein
MEPTGKNHYCLSLPSLKSQIKLGYTIKGSTAHPFSLKLVDFRNLIIQGERAKDVYYLFLIQLCDQLQLPILTLKGSSQEAYESLICESLIWQLDVETDLITLNPLSFGDEPKPEQITILARLLAEVYKLSSEAQNLLQVALWNTILTTCKPTLKELHKDIPRYRAHKDAYSELCSLLEVLGSDNLYGTYDNVSLGRLHSVPTIITAPKTDRGCLAVNLLLLKLLARHGDALPPLILFDPPPLNPFLIELLFTSYASDGGFLLFFDSEGTLPQLNPLIPINLVISTHKSPHSYYYRQLTDEEKHLLQDHHDLVAVKLDNQATHLVNII